MLYRIASSRKDQEHSSYVGCRDKGHYARGPGGGGGEEALRKITPAAFEINFLDPPVHEADQGVSSPGGRIAGEMMP